MSNVATANYWNSFYSRSAAPSEASSFAEFSLKFLQHHADLAALSNSSSGAVPPSASAGNASTGARAADAADADAGAAHAAPSGTRTRRVLIDLGCGNGRDTRYFGRARHGLFCVGVDAADAVIAKDKAELADHGGGETIAYYNGDFTHGAELDSVLSKHVTHADGKVDFVYSRFTLHAIAKQAASRVYAWVAAHLASDGFFFIEARSVLSSLYGVGQPDPAGDPDAWYHGHYRRFLRRDELLAELQALGLEIIVCDERSGLSPVGDDDPVLIRVICKPRDVSTNAPAAANGSSSETH